MSLCTDYSRTHVGIGSSPVSRVLRSPTEQSVSLTRSLARFRAPGICFALCSAYCVSHCNPHTLAHRIPACDATARSTAAYLAAICAPSHAAFTNGATAICPACTTACTTACIPPASRLQRALAFSSYHSNLSASTLPYAHMLTRSHAHTLARSHTYKRTHVAILGVKSCIP